MNRVLLEQVLKEELLVMKINQDIMVEHKNLVSERKDYLSMIAEEYAKLEHGEEFDVSTLEEGIWDSIKYYVGKLGSMEKGGKIGGDRKMRHVKAVDKLESAIEKAGGTVVKDLRSKIEQGYKQFPNMKSKEEYLAALLEIGAAYDSIDAAVQKNEMTADAANGVVEALREYVKYLLDYQLADVYKHFAEGQEIDEAVGAVAPTGAPDRRTPRRTGTAGGGGAPEDNSGVGKGKFTKRGAEGGAVDSATLDGLDSNKLPVILGLSGAAATLAALLLKSGWALSLLTKAKAGGAAAKGPVSTITTKLTPKAGEGFTQMLGRIAQGNPGHFGPNMPPADLFKAMQSLGINPTNPTELFSLGVDPAAYKAAIGSGATTIGDMFPASNKKLFLQKGASAVATLTKALGAATVGTGSAAVAAGQLAAASALASTLGIGLATAGAAVKLIRMKGKKSSRAQLLRDLSTELQPFENTVVVEPPTGQTGDFPIIIKRKDITDIVDRQSPEKLEKFLQQAGITDYSGDKLKQKLKKINLLPLFDQYLIDSDVGDYFRLEGRGDVKEQIDIRKVFGAYSDRETQILTFAFGVILRAYIAKETKKLLKQGVEIPENKLAQLNKAVINLTRKSFQNATKSSPKKAKKKKKPTDQEVRDFYDNLPDRTFRSNKNIAESLNRIQTLAGIDKKES